MRAERAVELPDEVQGRGKGSFWGAFAEDPRLTLSTLLPACLTS